MISSESFGYPIQNTHERKGREHRPLPSIRNLDNKQNQILGQQ